MWNGDDRRRSVRITPSQGDGIVFFFCKCIVLLFALYGAACFIHHGGQHQTCSDEIHKEAYGNGKVHSD